MPVGLISLLIVLIILCLVFWCVQQITAAFGVPEPVRTLVLVVFVIIVVLWLIAQLAGMGGPILKLH